jgi:hypothetical protein
MSACDVERPRGIVHGQYGRLLQNARRSKAPKATLDYR